MQVLHSAISSTALKEPLERNTLVLFFQDSSWSSSWLRLPWVCGTYAFSPPIVAAKIHTMWFLQSSWRAISEFKTAVSCLSRSRPHFIHPLVSLLLIMVFWWGTILQSHWGNDCGLSHHSPFRWQKRINHIPADNIRYLLFLHTQTAFSRLTTQWNTKQAGKDVWVFYALKNNISNFILLWQDSHRYIQEKYLSLIESYNCWSWKIPLKVVQLPCNEKGHIMICMVCINIQT